MELKDKSVIITGGSRGFGKALAKEFVEQGARVLISSRNKDELEKTSNALGTLFFPADVSIEKEVDMLAKFAIEKLGSIDIWVNNAGIFFPHTPIEEIDWEKAKHVIEVNLFGTIYGSKAALKQMKKQKSGTIMNILSTSALEGKPGAAPYCASKFGAVGFTKVLRLEGKEVGINVINIYPGGMKTQLFGEWKHKDYDKFMNPDVVARTVVENLKKASPEEEFVIRRPA